MSMKRMNGWFIIAVLLGMLSLTVSCGGGGGGGDAPPCQPAAVDMTGTWTITELTTNNNCSSNTVNPPYDIQITQNGNSLTVFVPAISMTYGGSLCGSTFSFNGSYPENNGTTTSSISANVSANGNSLTGTDAYTWSDGMGATCSGSTTFSGSRQSGGSPASPSAPSALSATAASSSSINLSWTDNSSDETGFKIERSTSAATGFTQIATVAANVTTYTNSTGLSASTTYYYRVRAYNGAGDSGYSNTANATTQAPPASTPTAPSALSATAASSSSINLSWTDTSNNETGFKIERSTSASTGFTQIATVAANVTTYTNNTGLSASTTYYYRVRAYNGAGDSGYSNTANATTSAPPVSTPAAPSNLSASGITATGAVLTWTDNSTNETGFEIGTCTGLVSVGGNGVLSCLSGFSVIATVGANVTSYTLTGLSAGTQYSRFVRAYNGSGSSANTGVRFTTSAGQQTITLNAIASNVVESNSLDSSWANTVYPNTYPTVGIMWASSLSGFPSSLAFAGLVKFNTTVLAGKTIDSATLNLEANSAPVGYYPQNFQIAAVASAWSSSTVTWNIMSSPSFLYYTASWMTFLYPTYAGQTYNIDLISTVQSWANGTYANNGLAFLSADYTYYPPNITSFDSYDFYVPTLTVTYH